MRRALRIHHFVEPFISANSARLHENGIGTVSSEALAKAAGVKPTQLRKDLAYFGTFGTRGLGYDVTDLFKKISEELGTSRLQPVILVGVGISASRCFHIADLKRKDLKSSPRSTPRRPANATRKSSSRFTAWKNCRSSSKAERQDGDSHRTRRRRAGSREPLSCKPASRAS
jgi:hypothetical protein